YSPARLASVRDFDQLSSKPQTTPQGKFMFNMALTGRWWITMGSLRHKAVGSLPNKVNGEGLLSRLPTAGVHKSGRRSHFASRESPLPNLLKIICDHWHKDKQVPFAIKSGETSECENVSPRSRADCCQKLIHLDSGGHTRCCHTWIEIAVASQQTGSRPQMV